MENCWYQLRHFPWASSGTPELIRDLRKKCIEQRAHLPLFSRRPKISFLVWDDGQGRLQKTLSSLEAQSYPDWEAVVVSPRLSEAKTCVASMEPGRVQFCDTPPTTDSLEGDYVGAIDAGDVLSPSALFFLVRRILAENEPEMLFSNEAVVDTGFARIRGFISKANASWFNLIHFNCVGKSWLLSREQLKKIRPLASFPKRSDEHRLWLEHYRQGGKFTLLPTFLYYRSRFPTTPIGLTSDAQAIKTFLSQVHFDADVGSVSSERGSVTYVTPKLLESRSASVSVIVCFRDKAQMTINCIRALVKKIGRVSVELVLVNNQSSDSELSKLREFVSSQDISVSWLNYDAPFNYADMHRRAIEEKCNGEYLLLLNNDVVWEGRGEIDTLVAWAQFDWVGTVGCLLQFPDGGVQHAGIRAVPDIGEEMVQLRHTDEELGNCYLNREVFASTFALTMIKRSTFEQIGLRPLEFPNGYGDVVFNLECRRAGLKNLCLGSVSATHEQAASRGESFESWEHRALESEFPELLEKMLRVDQGWNRVPYFTDILKPAIRRGLAVNVSQRPQLWKVVERWVAKWPSLDVLFTHQR